MQRKAAQEAALAVKERDSDHVIISVLALQVRQDMSVMGSIIGNIRRLRGQDPARHAYARLKGIVQRSALALCDILPEDHPAVFDQGPGANLGLHQLQRRVYERAHDDRDFQDGIDLLAGLGEDLELAVLLLSG